MSVSSPSRVSAVPAPFFFESKILFFKTPHRELYRFWILKGDGSYPSPISEQFKNGNPGVIFICPLVIFQHAPPLDSLSTTHSSINNYSYQLRMSGIKRVAEIVDLTETETVSQKKPKINMVAEAAIDWSYGN